MLFFPPAKEANREVANLTERKNPHTLVYGFKEFVCLSLTNFDPNYPGTGRTELPRLSSNQNQKPIEKKFAGLAARAVFVSLFSKTANS